MNEEDAVHRHNGILLSHKTERTLPLSQPGWTWKGTMPSEISQTEKDTYHFLIHYCCFLLYEWGLSDHAPWRLSITNKRVWHYTNVRSLLFIICELEIASLTYRKQKYNGNFNTKTSTIVYECQRQIILVNTHFFIFIFTLLYHILLQY